MGRFNGGLSKSSVYRGVSKHNKTKMYDAYIWMPNVDGTKRRGVQRFIGSYARETDAARAYDLARIKLLGRDEGEGLNFKELDYEAELKPLDHLSFEEYIVHVRLMRGLAPPPCKRRVVLPPPAPMEGEPLVLPVCASEPLLPPLEDWVYDEDRCANR